MRRCLEALGDQADRLLILADELTAPDVEAGLAAAGPGRLEAGVLTADPAADLGDLLRATLSGLAGPAPDVLLIHDPAQSASGAGVGRVLGALADGAAAAVPAVPVTDTVKTTDAGSPGFVGVTVDRSMMRTLQGPWGFAVPALAPCLAAPSSSGGPSGRPSGHLGRRLLSLAGQVSLGDPALLRLVDGDPAAAGGPDVGDPPGASDRSGDLTHPGGALAGLRLADGVPEVSEASPVRGRVGDLRHRPSPSAAGVVLVGGSGSRFGAALNKAYMSLAGRSVVSWSLDALAGVQGVAPLVLVVRPEDRARAEEIVAREVRAAGVEIVHGGPTRQASELAALRHLAPRIGAGLIDTVLIHDGARPLASSRLAAEILAAARRHGGAIPAIESFELAAVAPVPGGGSSLDCRHPGDDPHLLIQTPQGFEARELLAVYERAEREGFEGTDTASCLERFSELPVAWVPGETRNFKITFPRDLALAERLLARPTP